MKCIACFEELGYKNLNCIEHEAFILAFIHQAEKYIKKNIKDIEIHSEIFCENDEFATQYDIRHVRIWFDDSQVKQDNLPKVLKSW